MIELSTKKLYNNRRLSRN